MPQNTLDLSKSTKIKQHWTTIASTRHLFGYNLLNNVQTCKFHTSAFKPIRPTLKNSTSPVYSMYSNALTSKKLEMKPLCSINRDVL